ncbi:hypothetical protein DENSPDRAFT_843549 [Dentipellis sp. KUC8613]|nr:hypothetical protein DENSPDRAFT_843549 [Dentipellis sp. KUC8613]
MDDPEIQKIRARQEELLERRLRGEYESAVLHLSELVNNSLDTPSYVAAVHVEGSKNTRKSFLASLINPHLSSPSLAPDVSTFGSVLKATRDIGHILQETDIFSDVNAKIERSREPRAGPNDVDVIFQTREKGRYFLKTSTEVGNNEGNASATARIRNAFGGAETIEANASVGTKTRRSFNASLSAPLTSALDVYGDLSVFALDRDSSAFASCTEGLRGLKAALKTGSRTTGLHELGYEGVYRHIAGLLPSASISMRESAGCTFKSALFHSWLRDTRDSAITGSRGSYTKVSQEIAGLGGDVAFYKAEAEGRICRAVYPGIFVSLSARSGFLRSFSGPSSFSDRFQLGGPLSVRMFVANSLGPRDSTDSLGGDLYWALGLSVISDIPKRPHWPLKSHLFVNAGQLHPLQSGKSLRDNVTSCISQPTISAGVGLIYNFEPIRVELNFGVPLVAAKSDGCRKGLQVGMGIDFL